MIANIPDEKTHDEVFTKLVEAGRIVGVLAPHELDRSCAAYRLDEWSEVEWGAFDQWQADVDGWNVFHDSIWKAIAEYFDERSSKISEALEANAQRHRAAQYSKISGQIKKLRESLNNLAADDVEELEQHLTGRLSTASAWLDEIEEGAVSSGCMIRAKGRRPKGKPSQDDVHKLVIRLSNFYERWSGKQFRFYRHRDDKGSYEPVTGGHQFISCIVHVINAISLENHRITDQMVATECARSVTIWRDDRGPATPLR